MPASFCTICGKAARPTVPRSASNCRATTTIGVFIPPGVAHGFAAITDMVITYLVDGYYNPADELGLKWNDPAVTAELGRRRSPCSRHVTKPILVETTFPPAGGRIGR